MAAYMNFTISGETSRGLPVSVTVRAIARPTDEAALWLLRERYPSIKTATVTIPAAHGYPTEQGPVSASKLRTTPVRRTR